MFEIKNWFNFEDITGLVKSGWNDFLQIDLTLVKYSDISLATIVGSIIAGLIILKLLSIFFGRNKHAWADSGHLIYGDSHNQKGFLVRLITILPSLVLAIPMIAILFAIAGPFLTTQGEEKKYIETRTRIDLRDVSGSMAGMIPNTEISRSKLAMDAHLKFLEMRLGKGDRTSFWIFSDNGYMINDFIVDDKLQYFQAYDAPWGFSYNAENGGQNLEFVPSRSANIFGEGGTVLGNVLRSIIEQFDRDEEAQKKSMGYRPNRGRSVIIYSDSDIFDIGQTKVQIDELVKRNIAIYVVAVDDRNKEIEQDPPNPYETNPLLLYVVEKGGKFFIASDADSMTQAHMEIDRLEKVIIQVNKKTLKTLLFDKFICISILALMGIIPIGLLTDVFFKDYP